MTITEKFEKLDSLDYGELIFHNMKELNEWQAAVNRFKGKKMFEITNDKIIRIGILNKALDQNEIKKL